MRKEFIRIIDIHAHILPGVDDGAEDMDETRKMLFMAWEQGIQAIIATPHYEPHRSGKTAEQLKEIAERVQEEAWKIDSRFRIACGNEVLYSESTVEELRKGRALTMAGTPYVLVEFYPNIPAKDCLQAVRKLRLARYLPIIAHAERYACLRRKGVLDEIIRAGALIQLNYDSLAGPFWNGNVRWCRKAVRENKVDFFGTDMHGTRHRKPDTRKAVKYIGKKCGPGLARKLLWDNPDMILEKEIT